MKRLVAITALVALGGCCFGGGNFTVTGPTTSIGPGFAPDPMILAGSAGGPTDASTLSPTCRGHVGIIPSHTLQITGPMPQLNVLVRADQDTTLVVRQPDGTYVCNDDSDGLNPAVALTNLAAGSYNVFVGTYAAGASASYTLGLTTNPSVTPSTLGAGGVVPPFPPPVGGGPTLPPPPPVGGGGTPGTVLRSGVATVALVSGNVPGVAAGTQCTYTQTAVDAAQYGFDCRWQVTCGSHVVYGEAEGGFNPCTDPSWPPGTLVADVNTSGNDRDPSLVINAGGLMVRDDAQGARGEYQITATMAAPTPIPPG
ncbi:hypothetical protein [Sandaracinus amylolyticus]|uniref:Peptidase C-terminal archaeal/bacterial domain-containing protein n=1 Tax=Sandaracinus amylolyticus TaxID=927083 RepID=A0A0F6SHD9_9BACT|nr:hypothetical protein [Sandaracinus amylolyticus]AKF10274.1 hypothetical protein DB32_007423 [Sandaracinus amylolyticus]